MGYQTCPCGIPPYINRGLLKILFFAQGVIVEAPLPKPAFRLKQGRPVSKTTLEAPYPRHQIRTLNQNMHMIWHEAPGKKLHLVLRRKPLQLSHAQGAKLRVKPKPWIPLPCGHGHREHVPLSVYIMGQTNPFSGTKHRRCESGGGGEAPLRPQTPNPLT